LQLRVEKGEHSDEPHDSDTSTLGLFDGSFVRR
jgi:hypothetical protein